MACCDHHIDMMAWSKTSTVEERQWRKGWAIQCSMYSWCTSIHVAILTQQCALPWVENCFRRGNEYISILQSQSRTRWGNVKHHLYNLIYFLLSHRVLYHTVHDLQPQRCWKSTAVHWGVCSVLDWWEDISQPKTFESSLPRCLPPPRRWDGFQYASPTIQEWVLCATSQPDNHCTRLRCFSISPTHCSYDSSKKSS